MIHKEFMSKKQLKEYEAMEKEVMFLNHNYTIGEIVKVKNDFGDYDDDKISSPFSIMSGQVVAWLENKRCYLADRVEKI